MSGVDQSTKLFNTAIISTKIPELTNYSSELNALVQTNAFQVILEAIRLHAKRSGISEIQASEEVIQTFRKIDKVWNEYIFQEGLDKLRSCLNPEKRSESKKTEHSSETHQVNQTSIF